LRRIIDVIQEVSPESTWMEAVAQGKFPKEKNSETSAFAECRIGTFFPENTLPFSLDIIGQNNNGSSSSGKMAVLMGMKKVEDVGALPSLGPPYVRRIK
jgi:hypothetical protein